MEMRDVEILSYMDALDNFAATLVEQFNGQHRAGYGLDGSHDIDFFQPGTKADNIRLSDDILAADGLNRIAATWVEPPDPWDGQVGNGENALKLAWLLKSETFSSLGDNTLSDYYDSLIAKLGVDAEKAKVTHANQQILVGHLKNMQESVAGVSLDEEMANLIRFQNSYNAAARMMTAIDETLDKLINGTGIVGR
jgi:flagellar hook-associated protein 1 FlgK